MTSLRCYRRWLPLIFLVASAPMLTNCGSSPGHLSVQLSQQCQALGAYVPPPAIDSSSDYRELSAEALAALNKANRQSAALRRCDKKIIDDYAKAR